MELTDAMLVLHNECMAIQTTQGPCFPPPSAADSNGLLMLGGDLSVDWILTAYRQGIFPWPIVEGQLDILAWFSPDPRAILELDQLHVSRRLLRKTTGGIWGAILTAINTVRSIRLTRKPLVRSGCFGTRTFPSARDWWATRW